MNTISGIHNMIGGKTYATHFAGTIDGKNHTIDNFLRKSDDEPYMGLITWLRGTVKNLVLTNINIDNRAENGSFKATGALAGQFSGDIDKARISNVKVMSGTVRGTRNVGGLVAQETRLQMF